MVSRFSSFPDELSKNDELREYGLSGSDCNYTDNKISCETSKLVFDKGGEFKDPLT